MSTVRMGIMQCEYVKYMVIKRIDGTKIYRMLVQCIVNELSGLHPMHTVVIEQAKR
jgi:hypothetical protein